MNKSSRRHEAQNPAAGAERERGVVTEREGEKERLRSACVCGLYFSAGHWGDCVRESECDYYSLRVEVCVCVRERERGVPRDGTRKSEKRVYVERER